MLVPDAARGFALLGIAIANIATAWLVASPELPGAFFGGVVDDSMADKITILFTSVTAHNRGLPMFATLLGFGVGLIARSLARRNFPLSRARVVVVKRYAYLGLFGVAHMLLLFFGDIMFLYGVCGIIIGLMLGLSNKVLTVIAWIALTINALLSLLFFALAMFASEAEFGADELIEFVSESTDAASYPAMVVDNLDALVTNLTTLPLQMFSYLPVMLIGFVWARKGVLDDVDAHRPTLIRWLVAALIIAFGVGIPLGLSSIGVLPAGKFPAYMVVNSFAGAFTGPGILAGLALILQPLQRKLNEGATMPGWIVPIVALGKRSMSGYLMQSIIFLLLVYPFTLDIPRDMGAFIQTLIAVGVWLVTVLLALVLERRDMQGPFEKVHRRLAYGPTMRTEVTGLGGPKQASHKAEALQG
ncbi:MAG: DUF418 domain-containing protein [Corynebacterium sp.]|uniref:DUF418 domain-containing protein n=1 Tax=Corynebacterium sp. TaxID=1720 RepID=UPI0026DC656C|nr:DUF418 domain-containing protein [Corynebacterium sp.]MDO5030954.1 DUF418 domain-containing protein [Corynebacterium sp.]